jgi:dTDP-4-amino-4,6-dideoxygalactose transaminase
MLSVSKPWLPPFEKLVEKLRIPWDSGILTHNGPLVQEFEKRLEELWGVRNVIAVSNGTMAIQLALRALDVKGEVMTTPFTWQATGTAVAWEGCEVIFSDICPKSLCLDPVDVMENITEKTGAILPVNVYGYPPNFQAFKEIRENTGIPIIYDAAHSAFTSLNGKSTLSFGDISATSFHATKLINTGEGGACVTNDDKLAERLRALRFFGFYGDGRLDKFGTNAKMTEINAAIGLCCLDNIDIILGRRSEISDFYYRKLSNVNGIKPHRPEIDGFVTNNLYFPVIFDDEKSLLRVNSELIGNEIYARRYFYPSLNKTGIFDNGSYPVSEDFSSRILCLPIHTEMDIDDADKVIEVILDIARL